MKIRSLRVFAVVLVFLLALPMMAAARQAQLDRVKNDPIPLKNWVVPFQTLRHSSSRLTIGTNALPSAPSQFVAIAPCRVVDTRAAAGFPPPYGPPAMADGETRTFNIPASPCTGIPAAAAYSLSVAVVNYADGGGFVTAYPAGTTRPNVATVTFGPDPAFAVANAAIVPADPTGSIDVFASRHTELIIDINGYFAGTVNTGSAPVKITPANMGPFTIISDLCGAPGETTSFTNGETHTPPLGTGSFQITGTDDQSAALGLETFNANLIGDLTTLRYSTKTQDPAGTDQPYIYIRLDDDGDGTTDRVIYFIPANNQAQQGDVASDLWQTWNALEGNWNVGGDTGPGGALPLSSFATSHINGIRFAAGCGPATGGPRSRNIDDIEIGVGSAPPAVYDFERN